MLGIRLHSMPSILWSFRFEPLWSVLQHHHRIVLLHRERYYGSLLYHDRNLCEALWHRRAGILFLSKHKVKFVAALIGWAALFFVLPMAITSPEYIIDQYKEWHVSLAGKNMENMFSKMQNQSLLGRCAAGVCLHSDEHVAIRSFPCFHPQELRAALRLEGIALRADMV